MDGADPFEALKRSLLSLPNLTTSYATFMDEAQGFYHAVAWKDEAWLQALFAFEAALLLAVVLSRKRHYLLQGSLFVFIVALIAASETLNSWAKANWKRFSTQNYFDPRGVFAGVVYAGPLLCIMVVHVVVILKDAADLVVKVKRHELGVEARARRDKKDE